MCDGCGLLHSACVCTGDDGHDPSQADLQLDVHLAKVATYGERVIDAFYVRDVLGRKIGDEEHIREVERAIKARLSG